MRAERRNRVPKETSNIQRREEYKEIFRELVIHRLSVCVRERARERETERRGRERVCV